MWEVGKANMPREMLAFQKDDVLNVACRLGYTVSKEGKITEDGDSIKCHSCMCILTKDNLGVIAPGSKIPFCDNPACYSKYLAEEEKAI